MSIYLRELVGVTHLLCFVCDGPPCVAAGFDCRVTISEPHENTTLSRSCFIRSSTCLSRACRSSSIPDAEDAVSLSTRVRRACWFFSYQYTCAHAVKRIFANDAVVALLMRDSSVIENVARLTTFGVAQTHTNGKLYKSMFVCTVAAGNKVHKTRAVNTAPQPGTTAVVGDVSL